MKFRLAISASVLVLVVASSVVTMFLVTRVVSEAARVSVSEAIESDRRVLLEAWSYRDELHHAEARVAAEEPRLKAVVASDEVSQETVFGVVSEMRRALGAGLLLLTDAEGRLIADAADAEATGFSLADKPLIAKALEEGAASGVWLHDRRAFQMQATRLQFGDRPVGALVTGHELDAEFANAVERQTGAALVVELDGQVIAQSTLHSVEKLDESQLAALSGQSVSGRTTLELGGERFVAYGDGLPGYVGEHRLGYVVLRSLDRVLAPSRRLSVLLYGVLAVTLALGLALALWLSRLLSRPLEALVRFSRDVGAGRLEARASVGGPLEVQTLARSMNSMTEELERSRVELEVKQRLAREMEIAENIQTSMLPTNLQVPGLEISAGMVPADEVGGDYYDVLPAEDGCWIGIGDVAGHGLSAGLVMLMVQSCVSGLARALPRARPSQLVGLLNRVVFDNVRQRLGSREHATLTLIRYRSDGRIEFAGAHEDLVIWRAATGQVERVETTGIWIGGRAEIERFTSDHEQKLESGDVLILHTDGVTEAKNASGDYFGMDRLIRALSDSASQSVDEIRQAVMRQVAEWTELQVDDVSLLVARKL